MKNIVVAIQVQDLRKLITMLSTFSEGHREKRFASEFFSEDRRSNESCSFDPAESSEGGHPAAGFYVKKTTARKLQPNEITKEMRKQWKKRIGKACTFVMSNDCREYSV
jgi:hypothetical protein